MLHFNKACYCAIGTNVTASDQRHTTKDARVITDGSWSDNYTRGNPDERTAVFCTNNEMDGSSERWIQLDLEKSFVIRAAYIYDRVGMLLKKVNK